MVSAASEGNLTTFCAKPEAPFQPCRETRAPELATCGASAHLAIPGTAAIYPHKAALCDRTFSQRGLAAWRPAHSSRSPSPWSPIRRRHLAPNAVAHRGASSLSQRLRLRRPHPSLCRHRLLRRRRLQQPRSGGRTPRITAKCMPCENAVEPELMSTGWNGSRRA